MNNTEFTLRKNLAMMKRGVLLAAGTALLASCTQGRQEGRIKVHVFENPPRDERYHIGHPGAMANYSYCPAHFDRGLQSQYYYSAPASNLGAINFDVTMGNPFKGLMGSPIYPNYMYDSPVTPSLEWFYLGLDYVMKGNPDVVGKDKAFDWTLLEKRLQGAASRSKHVVFSVAVHYPGWDKLNVPQYLLDDGLDLRYYPNFLGGGYSPNYGDAKLLKALEQFIKALGERYDGDQRIAFIHLGLLGFWVCWTDSMNRMSSVELFISYRYSWLPQGEWHTFPNDWVPDNARENVVNWYVGAFKKTRLQARYPFAPASNAGFGLNDGSFTYETLGGEANGGPDFRFYFHNQVKDAGQQDLWKRAPISGETRPENQAEVFEPNYARRTLNRQDFMECVDTTHASYVYVVVQENTDACRAAN
jgi:hypothetical protein